MTGTVRLFSPAKINLDLRITGCREDGYHLLDSVVIFAALADQVSISVSEKDAIRITGEDASSINRAQSSLVAARDAFRAMTGWRRKVAIEVKKSIPVAAGLGGGSGNAAATLKGLMALSGMTLDPERLARLASSLGADVPVQMLADSVTMTQMKGIGDITSPLTPPAGFDPGLVLINPKKALSTAEVFAAYKKTAPSSGNDPAHPANPSTDPEKLLARGNDLEETACRMVPEIGLLLSELRQLATSGGGYGAGMSGSGATCFALFPNVAAARKALDESRLIKQNLWRWCGGLHTPPA